MRANWLILFVALVMGGLAAFLARDWLAVHTAGEAPPPSATIVVAAAPLGFGAQITADNVTTIPWASSTLPDGAFSTVQDVIKDGRRVVLTPLVRNEPVVRAKVTEPGQRGSLSSLIEEGKRAVTVAVDDVRGVAGFIFPGDFVDIALTRTDNREGVQNFSEVILDHVKVLAVDQLAGDRQERPTVAKAVTLELNPDQALKVLLATNVGRLSLILRQAAEEGSGLNRRITERDLSPTEPAPEPVVAVIAPALAAAPPPAPAVDPPPSPTPPVEAKQAAPSNMVTVRVGRNLKDEEYSVRRGAW